MSVTFNLAWMDSSPAIPMSILTVFRVFVLVSLCCLIYLLNRFSKKDYRTWKEASSVFVDNNSDQTNPLKSVVVTAQTISNTALLEVRSGNGFAVYIS